MARGLCLSSSTRLLQRSSPQPAARHLFAQAGEKEAFVAAGNIQRAGPSQISRGGKNSQLRDKGTAGLREQRILEKEEKQQVVISRLGIQLGAIKGNPFLGPGCYQSQEASSLRYSWGKKTLSTKGYVIGARTAQRFISEPQTVTPGPGMYQSFWNKDRKCQPSCAPFSTKTSRFPDKPSNKELFPGPGTYDTDKQLHKKITWPMKFGSPDWSLVPMPAKRMLKTEVQKLMVDREFIKHRNRVAYLSLYES
ncbi:protein pitchfork isoform X3 [Cygnus olor]|uniref:protein pitchfork isoform X3 n=1 Tax=Cygnus olor TaxID=8869 RepID=UPI001ADE50AD|nr:protein pitchfork isoform X3 [Cygnus olor]